MIHRRQLLERDPPMDWKAVFAEIRRTGWGTAEICFTLNIERNQLFAWEHGTCPTFENGRAILKLRDSLKTVQRVEPRIASVAA